eukprot:s2692_g1.t1
MATMDREAFAEYLDSSWLDFRQRLLAVYPDSEYIGPISASGGSSGSHDNPRGGTLGNSSFSDYDASTSMGMRSLAAQEMQGQTPRLDFVLVFLVCLLFR